LEYQSDVEASALLDVSATPRAESTPNPIDQELENWFVSEILPHQVALTSFLKRVSRFSSEVADLRQETYIRVYESAARARPRYPKAFLIATARNLVIDRLRHDHVVPIDHIANNAVVDLSIDELTPERRLEAHEVLRQLSRAFDALPERTRSVIWLRRIAGFSQRQAAASLGIDEGAVEGHMSRGLRRLAEALGRESPSVVLARWRSRLREPC
jgi:RNA polymerase sigma factor (sigma-70 family)